MLGGAGFPAQISACAMGQHWQLAGQVRWVGRPRHFTAGKRDHLAPTPTHVNPSPAHPPARPPMQGRIVPAEFIGVVKSQKSVYLKASCLECCCFVGCRCLTGHLPS